MEAVEETAPDLEVVCVTGLPARTARPFVPPFLCQKRPSRGPFRFAPPRSIPLSAGFRMLSRGFAKDELDKVPLGPWFCRFCDHGRQLRAMVEPCRRYSRLSPLCSAQGQFPAAHHGRLRTDGRQLPLPLAGACLPAGGEGGECDLSTAL